MKLIQATSILTSKKHSSDSNMKIIIVSSSTRKGRLSNRVALALQKNIIQKGQEAEILDLLELDLPTFEGTLSSLDDPTGKFAATAEQLKAADGLIFLTPEYNGAISSGLKNFIDVFAKDPFAGKPIGVATASTGILGGIRAAYQLQQSILSIFGYPIPQMLTVGEMDKNLDEQGEVIQVSFQPKLDRFLEAYLDFVKKISA